MKEYRLDYSINKGLNPLDESPRTLEFLSTCSGLFPEDHVLRNHPADTINTLSGLSCVFPYPQVFYLKKLRIVCTKDTIYEMDVSKNLTQKITGLTEGLPWSIADFYDYLVLTNGKCTIVRDAGSGSYSSVDTEIIPKGTCCLNLNGQLLVGAPNTTVPSGIR